MHPNIVREKIDNLALLNGRMQETYFVYMDLGMGEKYSKCIRGLLWNVLITFEIFATFRKQTMC